MTLKKQSIRSTAKVSINGKVATKEELIQISEGWSEVQENFFKKMLQQGGTFSLKGNKYNVLRVERDDLDSEGNKPAPIVKLPGERTF